MRKTILTSLALLALISAPAIAQLRAAAPPAASQSAGTAWDKVAGNWKSFRGKLRQQWGKLTKNDIAVARGRRDVLVGRIQARYGIDKDKADAQVDAWLKQQQ